MSSLKHFFGEHGETYLASDNYLYVDVIFHQMKCWWLLLVSVVFPWLAKTVSCQMSFYSVHSKILNQVNFNLTWCYLNNVVSCIALLLMLLAWVSCCNVIHNWILWRFCRFHERVWVNVIMCQLTARKRLRPTTDQKLTICWKCINIYQVSVSYAIILGNMLVYSFNSANLPNIFIRIVTAFQWIKLLVYI